MDGSTVERQKLVEAISALSDEALLELANFLDYLRYKSVHKSKPDTSSTNFLVTVAGLGNSGQPDISERDEEILSSEIDPVYGWDSKLNA